MADEKRKDKQFGIFYGKKELAFNNSVASEYVDNVIRQKIKYYSIDKERSVYDDLYNESKAKVIVQSKEIYARVQFNDPEIRQDQFSLDRRQTINVYFLYDEMYEELQFYPRVGDYIEYNNMLFEIATLNDDRPTMGTPHMKYTISLLCILARENDIVRDIRGFDNETLPQSSDY